ncbi:hypothetical protein SDC9_176807 [bioreactor metagenome]|uniref:Uncharacterized protein n=1 Tax=bioreactor metagenome TaxID=1076179 RepID=A0A645GZ74_9ZZZZ
MMLVIANNHAKPAADGKQVEDTRCCVHGIPGSTHVEHVVDHTLHPHHLNLTHHRFEDVQRQDGRHERVTPFGRLHLLGESHPQANVTANNG